MGQTITPGKLTEAIGKAPPAVQDWLNDPANPLKDSLFARARHDEASRDVMGVIPDKKTVEDLVQTHGKYHDLNDSLSAVETPKQASQFWAKLWTDFATKDAQGKVTAPHPAFARLERSIYQTNNDFLLNIATEQGRIHPILAKHLNTMLDVFNAKAKSTGDYDLEIAVEILREANAPSSAPPAEPTAAQKKLDADRLLWKGVAGEADLFDQILS